MELLLTEKRFDGSERKFKLTVVDDVNARVEMLEGPGKSRLSWTLTREKQYYRGKFELQDVLAYQHHVRVQRGLSGGDLTWSPYMIARSIVHSPKFDGLVGSV